LRARLFQPDSALQAAPASAPIQQLAGGPQAPPPLAGHH